MKPFTSRQILLKCSMSATLIPSKGQQNPSETTGPLKVVPVRTQVRSPFGLRDSDASAHALIL